VKIAAHDVGAGHSAFIIAEIAQAHDGSLGMAHAFIDAAADAGADAVKFQTHLADAESTLDEPFRVRFSRQDATRLDYWRRMEFKPEQWHGLAAHVRERGLVFLSSAFSVAAVELLKDIGVAAWKIGSGEFAARELWGAMVDAPAPILFSTGMATRAETRRAVDVFRSKGLPFILLQCTTAYPAPLDVVGLNVLEELREEFGCPVGLSDHSGSIFPGLAALARGANVLEVHVTFDRRMFGPDSSASLTFEEVNTICRMRDALIIMDAHPVDKDDMAKRLRGLRKTFGRSLAPTRPLSTGAVLGADVLTAKKPGGGISPDHIEKVLGKRLARDVSPDRILRWTDLVRE
jgi:N,N'-diacetyllegionaminate synthase